MKWFKSTSLFLFILIACNSSYAQPSVALMKQRIESDELQQPMGSVVKLQNNYEASILFTNNTRLQHSDAVNWVSDKLALRAGTDLLVAEQRDTRTGNLTSKKIHQYFRGIKVEHGVINATSKSNRLAMLQLEFYSIPDRFNTRPSLTEQQAFDKALAFVGAKFYAWTNNESSTNTDFQKPRGELVIIQTYQQQTEVCLAYKFNIYALQPLSRAYIYVNASTGKIVLSDAIIKHAEPEKVSINQLVTENNYSSNIHANHEEAPLANSTGVGATRYSGTRQFITDLLPGGGPSQYRLRQSRNGQLIKTLNYERRPNNPPNGNNDSLAIDFTDNDNNWSAAEFNNANFDNVALDVNYNMQWVSDYYLNILQRNGWDDDNAPIIGYVHVSENDYDNNNNIIYKRWYDNAYWNGSTMHFGDGDGLVTGPKGYLDVCAHELSHAITGSTSNLVYRWESGAMNEGFSDIWAACISNYAKTQDPTLSGEIVWRYGEKRDRVQTDSSGLRDLKNPLMYKNPSTYKSTFWQPADYESCPSENAGVNDHCGVHTNSGVLDKWFYLITQGEIGINTNSLPYSIVGLGFTKTEQIAYLMEQNLTPNANYATAMDVSLNIAITQYGVNSNEFKVLKAAWKAVGIDSNIYNMQNTPAFTSNNFTSIAVSGKDIFAGTSYNGLYWYNDTNWVKMTELTDVKINDIKADDNSDIWIAQSGRSGQSGGGSSIAGGVNWLKYPYSTASTLYTVNPVQHVPSRNARSMYVQPGKFNGGINKGVWVATGAYITSGNTTSGMLGQGLYNNNPSQEFQPVSAGINIASGTVGCTAVGGFKNEVWTFVPANYGINQLLRYSTIDNSLLGTYDHNSEPVLPTNFSVRAIYGDEQNNRLWVGLANGGVVMMDENKRWHSINFTSIFPPGTAVNPNAITGDPYGDIYIGTTAGLVFFDHGIGQIERIDDESYYRLYTKKNGLPSTNINAIAYSVGKFKLYVATDSGIVFWNPLCIGGSCDLHRFYENGYAESKGNGNWSNPATWSTNMVPDSFTVVVINDTITVDINAKCQSLRMIKPGTVKVNAGLKLKIFEVKEPINDDHQVIGNGRRREEE